MVQRSCLPRRGTAWMSWQSSDRQRVTLMNSRQHHRRKLGLRAWRLFGASCRRIERIGLRPTMEGLEERRLLAATPTPVGSIGTIVPATGAITEFPTADPNTMGTEIARGLDGNLWSNEINLDALFPSADFQTISTGAIAVTDPTTGHITAQFPIPSPTPIAITGTPLALSASIPLGIMHERRPGQQSLVHQHLLRGAIASVPRHHFSWGEQRDTGGGGREDRPDRQDHRIPDLVAQWAIHPAVEDRDGPGWEPLVHSRDDPVQRLNAHRHGRNRRVNPQTGVVTEFPTPTPDTFPIGITLGLDGNLYFTSVLNANTNAAANRADQPIDRNHYRVPQVGIESLPKLLPGIGMTTMLDGNIWFAENDRPRGQFLVHGRHRGVRPLGQHFRPGTPPRRGRTPCRSSTTLGPWDGKLWFTEANVNVSGTGDFSGTTGSIGKIDPLTHTITEFSTPSPADLPFGIVDGPNGPDGNLWFANFTVPGLIQAINMIESQDADRAGPPGCLRRRQHPGRGGALHRYGRLIRRFRFHRQAD